MRLCHLSMRLGLVLEHPTLSVWTPGRAHCSQRSLGGVLRPGTYFSPYLSEIQQPLDPGHCHRLVSCDSRARVSSSSWNPGSVTGRFPPTSTEEKRCHVVS